MSKASQAAKQEERWWRQNFPTVTARAVADEVVDGLDVNLPMSAFVDAWIEAYLLAGGVRGKR